MLRRISREVKTTVAEAQTVVFAPFEAYSLSSRASGRGCNSAVLRRPRGAVEAVDYPIVGTVASRPGRTKASVPTLALGFAVAGTASLHWAGLVLASRRLAARMACGSFGLLNVGGYLSACRFQHVVFLAVMVDLQSAQEMYQIPRVIGLNGVGE
jgi:hypothetical protein